MFSPYGILLNTSEAAVNPDTDKLVAVIAEAIELPNGSPGFAVTYAITGENVVSIDFNIGYDSSVIKPANYKTGAAFTGKTIGTGKNENMVEFKDLDGYCDTDQKSLNFTQSKIRLAMSEFEGTPISLANEGFTANDYGFNYYMEAFTIYFYSVDTSVKELTTDMITWATGVSGMPTGFKYQYNNGGANIPTVDTKVVTYVGFAGEKKNITDILISNPPSKLKYNNGDALDFTDGKVKISYDDNTYEELDIKTAINNGKITVDSTYASDGTRKATFTSTENTTKKVTLPYYTLSGVQKYTDPTNLSYKHNQNVNWEGAELKLTYTDCNNATSTETLSVPTGISDGTITPSTSKLTISNKNATISYKGYPVTFSFIVTDPIKNIAVTTPPSKVTYNDTETVDFAGGKITVYKESGASEEITYPNSAVTLETTVASISNATTKWLVSGGNGLEAGTQPITVKYTEPGTTNVFRTTYNITVNDQIDTIDVTTQPTAKNKYGWNASQLDFSGLVVTVNTTGRW